MSAPNGPTLMLADERRRVAEACRLLSRSGLVVGTAGNVSVRVGDHVVISPSGVDYEAMSAEDVGVHDLGGAPVDARLKPSSELPLHLAIYGGTDHTAIVHTHAPAVHRAVDAGGRGAGNALLHRPVRRGRPCRAIRHLRIRRPGAQRRRRAAGAGPPP